jgi:uncharacterized protein (TIGR02001 family)
MIDTKPILTIAVVLLTAATAPAFAQQAAPQAEEEKEPGWWLPGEFTGTVTLANDYFFRGISQTDHNPALQGSIYYTVDTDILGTSIYGGVWGSNVDFNDNFFANNKGAGLELDWSFGLTGELLDTGIGWTLGAIYYNYPGARSGLSYDYWEFAPALTYPLNDWLTLTGNFYYSPDFFLGSGDSYYANGGVKVAVPIPENWFGLTLDASTGHQWIEDNTKFGADDYQDWRLGVTVSIKGVDLTAAYIDTNLEKHECFGGTNLCEARALLSIGASF